jgi:HTH-type transcriptional regulator / antitoxin HigA
MRPPVITEGLHVLKTPGHYDLALHELEELMQSDPAPGSPQLDQLELLTVLLKDYEARHFKFEPNDPVDAIEFRMAEQRLRQKDLAPFLGGKNRVSEILARKRPLTLDMIRALHAGLQIPLPSLINPMKPKGLPSLASSEADDHFEWNAFPISEMKKRGWFDTVSSVDFDDSEELVRAFLAQVGSDTARMPALFRRTLRGLGTHGTSRYSLIAWTSRLLIRAKTIEHDLIKFSHASLEPTMWRELSQLSTFEDGPLRAQRFLRELGMILLIEPSLPSTLVDGAALLSPNGRPIIGMTLRFDRVDSFWFTLFHELAHVQNHLSESQNAFVDRNDEEGGQDPLEAEADLIARDSLLPRAYWRASSVSSNPTASGIKLLANKLNIHPAIVAGRVQFESKRYDRFGDLLGRGSVRKLFPESTRGAM